MYNKFVENFLEMLVAERNAAANTVSAYQTDLQKFFAFFQKNFPHQDIFQLSQALINDYLSVQKISNNSKLRIISVLKQFYLFAVQEGWTDANPMDVFLAPKKQRALPKSLTEAEVTKLLQAAHQGNTPENLRLAALLEILYASGLRVSELISLPFSCIRESKHFIYIKGKGGKERLVPLNNFAIKAINQYLPVRQVFLQNEPQNKWLFPSSSKQGFLTRQRLGQLLKDLAQQANIPTKKVSPHVIRHAFATHMLNNGADLLTLQKLLGHADISTTQIYTHVMPDNLLKFIQQHHPLAAHKNV